MSKGAYAATISGHMDAEDRMMAMAQPVDMLRRSTQRPYKVRTPVDCAYCDVRIDRRQFVFNVSGYYHPAWKGAYHQPCYASLYRDVYEDPARYSRRNLGAYVSPDFGEGCIDTLTLSGVKGTIETGVTR